MLGEFPQAIAMQHPNQPDDTILQSDAQCILLSSRGLPVRVRPPCEALNVSLRACVLALVASLTRGL